MGLGSHCAIKIYPCVMCQIQHACLSKELEKGKRKKHLCKIEFNFVQMPQEIEGLSCLNPSLF